MNNEQQEMQIIPTDGIIATSPSVINIDAEEIEDAVVLDEDTTKRLTERDAEFYVDGNFYVRGQLDGKYQDFYLTRVKMNYNNRKNSTDNGKD